LKDGRFMEKKLDQLAGLGMELEHFGGSTFLVKAVPAILVGARWKELLFELIPLLKEESDLTGDRALDRFLTVMACHGAIRSGKRMSREEMSRLLDQLEEMDLPTNCPHGRPTMKRFSYHEIERMFKRVV
jgi:DNA mismatch repair protein MutL